MSQQVMQVPPQVAEVADEPRHFSCLRRGRSIQRISKESFHFQFPFLKDTMETVRIAENVALIDDDVCVFIHIYIYTYLYLTYVYVYIYIYIYMHMYTYI